MTPEEKNEFKKFLERVVSTNSFAFPIQINVIESKYILDLIYKDAELQEARELLEIAFNDPILDRRTKEYKRISVFLNKEDKEEKK